MASTIIALFDRLGWDPAAVAALLAVIPVTEIKGAVLYVAARGTAVWRGAFAAYLSSVMLAALLCVTVPVTLAFVRRIPFLKKATAFLTDRLGARADRIAANAEKGGEKRVGSRLFGVFAFVALPLPLTGIWAGALLAALLGLSSKDTFFALAAGNFSAAGIVLTVALLAGEKADFVFDVFLCVALAALFFAILKSFFSRRRRSRAPKGA